MPMNKDLFLAILAMDSYNRGYGQGIIGLASPGPTNANNLIIKIGNATILRDANDQPGAAQAAGFYALAYDLSTAGIAGLTGTVISYRGSDNINGGLAFANFLLRLNTAGILFVPSYGVTVTGITGVTVTGITGVTVTVH